MEPVGQLQDVGSLLGKLIFNNKLGYGVTARRAFSTGWPGT